MSECILGVDIAKKKFDAALLINDKLKHKVFKNNQEGFTELSSWLEKQGVGHIKVCMEASSTYGDELATSMHDAGHTVSIISPARIKGFAQSEPMRPRMITLMQALLPGSVMPCIPNPGHGSHRK